MNSWNIGVIGGGSWGTTVAHLLSRHQAVKLWARNSDTVNEINQDHSNQHYLPQARLSPKLSASADLQEVIEGKSLIVMAIPSQNFREVLTLGSQYIKKNTPIISLSKGLELSTGSRMTQVINAVLPDHPCGVLTGPNLAIEIMAGFAAASVLAISDKSLRQQIQNVFHSSLFRVYRNHDVIGCELGGVLKNIIAIAAGMGDGQGAGDNTRSAIITRGLAEMTRLGTAMGGDARTFAGLAGVGDLVATCTSEKSRNRTVGFRLGMGQPIEAITRDMFMVAEGVKSAPAVTALADQFNVKMPICQEVCAVVQGKSDAKRGFKELLKAEIGSEAEPF
jgi:glycerol-3-phosphate dehydrogenase (NAD(P)+)